MASEEPVLDEIQWCSPWHVANYPGGLHENTILFYFAESPFFDRTSNNAVLASQAMFNVQMFHLLQTRKAFEGRLDTMSGLEFRVAQEPAEMTPGAGTGVWVIRKQTRRKKPGDDDEINVLSTYYVVGENIYMAPSVADVLGNRLLSVINSVNKFMSTASSLPDFTPSIGHTYMPPPNTLRLKAPESQPGQISKENTPVPDSISNAKKALPSTNTNTYLSSRLLEETINITLKYGDEYMDENPITGQPGDFHLSTTGRKDSSKLMVPVGAKGPTITAAGTNKPAAPPLNIPSQQQQQKKGAKSVIKSPRTPASGTPKTKRRRSKVPNSAGDTSPA